LGIPDAAEGSRPVPAEAPTGRSGPSAPTVVIVGITILLFVIHVAWLARFRFDYVTEWDESGYIAIALDNVNALRADGVVEMARTVLDQGVQAPLVPLSAAPFNLILGDGVDASLIVEPAFFALLVLASYGIARRLISPWWAVLAASCVATVPLVADYSRLFHFAVPAAALFAAALYALLRAEGLTRRRWALAAGALLGMTVLARTMTIAYVPGFAAAAALPLVARGRRADRIVNLILLLGAAAAVAAIWYVPNLRSVGHYLLDLGYGAESESFGADHSPLSVAYWTVELRGLAGDLYLPLAIVLVACILVALASWVGRGGVKRPTVNAVRAWLLTPAAILAVIVLEGYFALTSSHNQGTAFTLPLLPAFVVLVVAAVASIRQGPLRMALVSALIGVSAFNAVMKGGWIAPISQPATIDVPGIGDTAVADGRGVIHDEIEGAGYDVGDPTDPLPDLHKRWLPFAGEVTAWIDDYAERRGTDPHLATGFPDLLLSNTRFALASQLYQSTFLPTSDLKPFPDGDTERSYREQLERFGNNFLVTGEPSELAPPPAVSPEKVERAARSAGFEPVREFTLPDGRKLSVWWRDVEAREDL
jgi:hypothetical protein